MGKLFITAWLKSTNRQENKSLFDQSLFLNVRRIGVIFKEKVILWGNQIHKNAIAYKKSFTLSNTI